MSTVASRRTHCAMNEQGSGTKSETEQSSSSTHALYYFTLSAVKVTMLLTAPFGSAKGGCNSFAEHAGRRASGSAAVRSGSSQCLSLRSGG